MGAAGEQPPELPLPVGNSVHLEAHASGEASVNQAARDLHLHYRDGMRGARRAELGTAVQGECPYPGLASFGQEQTRWFFGRDELTAELVANLDARLHGGGLQVVVAPSGAGKSSLLHAGLLPQLAAGALEGSSRWPTLVFTPTAHPLAALATEVAELTGADPATQAGDPRQCVEALRGHVGDEGSRILVVVDQFEELFTLCTDDQDRRAFIKLLTQLASPPHPVGLVVLGLRADFYAACANYPPLRAALQDNQLVVGPMSDTELREAIRYPAQDVGLDVEPGLVELLLRDLGDTGMTGYEAGRLPLLAHALRATWQQRHGHVLTVDGYRATGGIQRAVATSADRVFTGLNPAGQHTARTLFLRLIKIGDGTEDTRRRVSRADLLRGLDPGTVGPVVDAFTQARLLTQDQDTVEITHEALLRAWPRLRQWIDTDRTGNLTRQELEDAASAWDRDGRDTAGLYRGSRLETARTWTISKPREDLSPTASAFLAASTAQQRRTAKLRRTVLVVLSVLALVASSAAAAAFQQTGTAHRERDDAIFNQIIAQADRLRSTDVSLAAQLDLTAYRMRPKTQDLYTALITDANTALSTPLTGHTNAVRAVVFSRDGRTLASGGDDKTVRLWDMTDPTHPTPLGTPLASHSEEVNAVAFSPDDRTLATGGKDNAVRLWDVTDRAHPTSLGQPLAGHTKLVTSLSFSQDGSTLASGSTDHTVRLWDVTDRARPTPVGQPLAVGTKAVDVVVFSPDGRTLATASDDKAVRLWNVTDPAHPTPLGAPLVGNTKNVNAVAFSPDGHILASGGNDQTVRLWDVTDPARPTSLGLPLADHTNYVNAAAFSPDSHTLAAASDDHKVRLWDLTDPAHPVLLGAPLAGHTNYVNAVVFSRDGRTLATAGSEGTVRLWDIPAALMAGHGAWVRAVVFSSDGRTLATASDDRTVRLWNATDPAHPTPLGPALTGPTKLVKAVMFSPDGHTLAAASGHAVWLWNVTDLAHPTLLGQPLAGHTKEVNAVVFSSDGRTLASGGDDHTVRLWNVTDLVHPTPLGPPLTGHPEPVRAVVFSPDGRTLATASDDQMVRLWNVTDLAHPTLLGVPLVGHTKEVNAVVFSPDGHTLASGSRDQTVRLWNVTDPAHPTPLGQPLIGHIDTVNAVAFSHDGQTLASGSRDQKVRLWDVADPAHPTSLGQPLTGHTGFVTSVAFSPDGQTLASGSADRTVRLWGMDVNQAIRRICSTTRNNLTPAKWEKYVSPDLPYQPPCS